MKSEAKFIMKNLKTGQYWCKDTYPQTCASVWQASKFDTAEEAISAKNVLLSQKYKPEEFEPVKVELIEHI